jgi:hypothetical protein
MGNDGYLLDRIPVARQLSLSSLPVGINQAENNIQFLEMVMD